MDAMDEMKLQKSSRKKCPECGKESMVLKDYGAYLKYSCRCGNCEKPFDFLPPAPRLTYKERQRAGYWMTKRGA